MRSVLQDVGNMEMKDMPQGAPCVLGKHRDLQDCMQSHMMESNPRCSQSTDAGNLRVPGGFQEKMVPEMGLKGLGMGRFVSNIHGENKDKKKA